MITFLIILLYCAPIGDCGVAVLTEDIGSTSPIEQETTATRASQTPATPTTSQEDTTTSATTDSNAAAQEIKTTSSPRTFTTSPLYTHKQPQMIDNVTYNVLDICFYCNSNCQKFIRELGYETEYYLNTVLYGVNKIFKKSDMALTFNNNLIFMEDTPFKANMSIEEFGSAHSFWFRQAEFMKTVSNCYITIFMSVTKVPDKLSNTISPNVCEGVKYAYLSLQKNNIASQANSMAHALGNLIGLHNKEDFKYELGGDMDAHLIENCGTNYHCKHISGICIMTEKLNTEFTDLSMFSTCSKQLLDHWMKVYPNKCIYTKQRDNKVQKEFDIVIKCNDDCENFIVRSYIMVHLNGVLLSKDDTVKYYTEQRQLLGRNSSSYRIIKMNYNHFSHNAHNNELNAAENLADVEIYRSSLENWKHKLYKLSGDDDEVKRYSHEWVIMNNEYNKLKLLHNLFKERVKTLKLLDKYFQGIID